MPLDNSIIKKLLNMKFKFKVLLQTIKKYQSPKKMKHKQIISLSFHCILKCFSIIPHFGMQ